MNDIAVGAALGSGLPFVASCNHEKPRYSKAARTRQRIIEEFQQATDFGLLVMSPVAAGLGLAITAANNVIHLERR